MSATAVSLTKEQRRAVEARSSSVALSAGAGCGKTFVLTERFLADLEPSDDEGLFAENLDPAKLHELIAITFTDRAAREMRERIRKKCYDRLKFAPERQVDYWLKLLRSLDNARVSTIHAFCGALLRSNAVEAGLDPRFTVVEQAQADTLLAELIEDTLREKLSGHEDPLHKPILNLTEAFGLWRLQTMVAKLLRDGRSIDFAAWLARTPDDVVAIWDRIRREVVVPGKLTEIAASPSAAAVLAVIGELNGSASGKLAERCKALSALLPGLAISKRPAADLEAIVENARIQKDGGVKAWPDPSLRERFRGAADKLRKKANGAKDILEWDPSTAMADAKAGLELLALASTVSDRYNQRKRELAWLDFNDLLQRARQLLTDPAHLELQQRLASQVRLLLVDECQDTDAEQVELIKALCGGQIRGGNLFYVGDYKQSIYRFRGADPSVFRQLQEETPKPGRLPLSENFRSQPAILNFVNALFCDVLSGAANKSSTNGNPTLSYAPLIATRKQIIAEPAVEFLWSGVTVEETNDLEESSTTFARKQEAEYIARRIRAMLGGKEKIASDKQPDGTWAARPVEYKDIAILFRALSDVQHYEEALRNYEIPYYLVGGHAFYAQQEIHDIVNLLRALASSADTVSLAGVLRSPMFALTDEALFWLAQHPQGLAGGLFASRVPSELSDSDRERVQFAATTLKYLRDRKDRVSITALLNEALAMTGYDAALLAEFMGERKLANLRKLLEQARAFDQSGVFGLADFIVQLSDFVAEMPREPLAATHPEGTDVVRLMTIHQSKGLEFPVVFVPDMNRKRQKNDEQVVWDSRLGPLVKVPKQRSKESLSGLDFYQELNDAEEQAERVRLLYVATTRAADYLVLSSGMAERDFDNPSAPWTKLLAERFDLETGRFVASLPTDKDYKTPLVKVELSKDVSPTAVANPWHDLDGAIEKALEHARKFESQATNGKLLGLDSGDGPERLAETILPDRAAQRRFSISRLNGHLQPLEEESSAALLLADGGQENVQTIAGTGGIDLGVLVHQALARVDFASLIKSDRAAREETISKIVKRYEDGDDKRSADLMAEAVQLVELFLQSGLAGKLAAAKVVHRELEFLLAWPPDERKRGGGGEGNGPIHDGQYLQGFIDCLYQDAACGWHIVDYKSNQVAPAATKSAAAQFEMQLGVYALAVEKILGQPPVELTVHFLRPSLDHHFVWNEGMRKNIIERVNQAITAAVMSESPA